jgi:hypothetical protein
MNEEKEIMIIGEFGHISAGMDTSANGPRLMLRDVRTGKTAYFDPLELESLVWCRHEQLAEILDPARTRWPSEGHDDGSH